MGQRVVGPRFEVARAVVARPREGAARGAELAAHAQRPRLAGRELERAIGLAAPSSALPAANRSEASAAWSAAESGSEASAARAIAIPSVDAAAHAEGEHALGRDLRGRAELLGLGEGRECFVGASARAQRLREEQLRLGPLGKPLATLLGHLLRRLSLAEVLERLDERDPAAHLVGRAPDERPRPPATARQSPRACSIASSAAAGASQLGSRCWAIP